MVLLACAASDVAPGVCLTAQVAMVSATGSSYVFATVLFGTFYDSAATSQQQQERQGFGLHPDSGVGLDSAEGEGAGEGRECFGAVCVRRAALASAVCCGVATVLSLILLRRQQRAAVVSTAEKAVR
jgi:hypothetical protein